jgi:hypothetical protein
MDIVHVLERVTARNRNAVVETRIASPGGNAPQSLSVLDAAKIEHKGADAELGTIPPPGRFRAS